MAVKSVDISEFKARDTVLQGSEWLLVVKSQDQLERRRRMLESREGGRIGRIKERPTAIGLLAKVTLYKGQCEMIWKQEFREPRHIRRHPSDGYLITEINCVKWVAEDGRVKKVYRHPFFAFLHTIDISPDGKRMLVVSSGYDACFEIDLETEEVTWEWFAWEHGFNPDDDGVWLARTKEQVSLYEREGKRASLIDPEQYGEQGILTSNRTAHPNAAVYDVYLSGSVIISIAHDGRLYRVALAGDGHECVCEDLDQMSHGICYDENGWMVTNTTKGEWCFFSKNWQPLKQMVLQKVGNKVEGTENVEWVQQVLPAGNGVFLCLDANRGLIAVDVGQRKYTIFQPNANWCIQDALLLGGC